MKKVLFVLAMMISISALAEEKQLSEDAAKIANVLARAQESIGKELKELESYAYISEVTINEMEDLTIYKLSGMGVIGGDMACGVLTLEIAETRELVAPPSMMNPTKITYKAKLHNPCKTP